MQIAKPQKSLDSDWKTDEIGTIITQAAQFKLSKTDDPEVVAHDFLDFSSHNLYPDLEEDEVIITPTITSYYGHEVIAPAGIDMIELRRFKRIRLVALTLHRVAPGKTVRILAWQGDNDTFHLMSPLPGEDEVLGVYHAIVFGVKKREDEVKQEQKNYYLNEVSYKSTAVLDVDVTTLPTEFPVELLEHQVEHQV